jgi:predicted glycoside hydrolase/deacetylase ChbG (UPF0249 family)
MVALNSCRVSGFHGPYVHATPATGYWLLGTGGDYNRSGMAISTSQKYVIINADDFGFAPGITEGILRAHLEGVVTSTTLAANMPSVEAAAKRLGEAPDLGVGVHLNVSQGPPLSQRGRALAGEDGLMNRTAAGVILACIRRPSLIDEIESEFDAQIRWVLDHGIRPTHLDSHRHAHAFTPIFARVVGLARRYDIRYIRRHREVLPGRRKRLWPAAPAKQRRFAWLLNVLGRGNVLYDSRPLVTNGTWGVEHTGCIGREFLLCAAGSLSGGVTEIMTHPGLPEGVDASTTRLLASRQEELRALCEPEVRAEFERNGVKRIHYGHLDDLSE